jgi:hypothetical protein
LRLARVPRSRNVHPRVTHRNLQAVLKLIDRNDPASSPLLTHPTRPHGPVKVPVFSGPDADKYRLLADWVHDVVSNTVADHPLSDTKRVEVAAHVAQESGAHAQKAPKPDAKRQQDQVTAGSATGSTKDKSVAASQVPPPTLSGFRAKDPFDPEIFNRRFSARRR